MVWEALNDAGHYGKKIIIILNDNEMSIGKNVGAISIAAFPACVRQGAILISKDLSPKQ